MATLSYGLIGQSHLSMLDNTGEALASTNDYSFVALKTEKSSVMVHLFGGMHADFKHYEAMITQVKRDGLQTQDDTLPKGLTRN